MAKTNGPSGSNNNPPPKRPDETDGANDPKNKSEKTDKDDEKKREDAAMEAYEQILMQFMNDTFSKLVEEAASMPNPITEPSAMDELFEDEQ